MGIDLPFSTNYPAALDTFPLLTDGVHTVLASHPNALGDAIEAMEVKLGITNSPVTTSIDYILRQGRPVSERPGGNTGSIAYLLDTLNPHTGTDILLSLRSATTERFRVEAEGDLIVGAGGSGIIQLGTTDVDKRIIAEQNAAPDGEIRYNAATNQWELSNNGGAFSAIALSGAGAGTLDASYDFGGAGAGRTITADAGAVVVNNAVADATNTLELTRTVGSGAALSIAGPTTTTGNITKTGDATFTLTSNKAAGGVAGIILATVANFGAGDAVLEINDTSTLFQFFGTGNAVFQGTLAIDSGTGLAAPGLWFNGDPNTGIWRPEADRWIGVAGGVAVLDLVTGGGNSWVAIPFGTVSNPTLRGASSTTGLWWADVNTLAVSTTGFEAMRWVTGITTLPLSAAAAAGVDSSTLRFVGQTSVALRNIDLLNEADAGTDTYRLRVNNHAGTALATLNESGALTVTAAVSANSFAIGGTTVISSSAAFAGYAASSIRSTLELYPATATAGDDSPGLFLRGYVVGDALRYVSLLNEADAGTDTYRLRVNRHDGTRILQVDESGNVVTLGYIWPTAVVVGGFSVIATDGSGQFNGTSHNFTSTTNDGTTLSPTVTLRRQRAGAQAANDVLGSLRFGGRDAAGPPGTDVVYGQIASYVVSPTVGAYYGAMDIRFPVAGADTSILHLLTNSGGSAVLQSPKVMTAGSAAFFLTMTDDAAADEYVLFAEDGAATPGAGTTLFSLAGNGTVHTPYGSAAAPQYSTTASANSGLYFSSNTAGGISNNGVNVMTWESASPSVSVSYLIVGVRIQNSADLLLMGQSATTGTTLTIGSDVVTVTGTPAGAMGEELQLYQNSASPAASDVLGRLSFNGEDSLSAKKEYARIDGMIYNPDSTVTNGRMSFYVRGGGAGGTASEFARAIATEFNTFFSAPLFYTTDIRSGGFGFFSDTSIMTIYSGYNIGTGTTSLALGHSGTFAQTSGTTKGIGHSFLVGPTSGTALFVVHEQAVTFAPTTAGSPALYAFSQQVTVNQTGVASGNTTVHRIDVTETAVVGSIYLADWYSASARRFAVTNAGQVLLVDGSVSAPSLAHNGEANTGIYFPAGAISLAVLGVKVFEVLDDSTYVRYESDAAVGPSLVLDHIRPGGNGVDNDEAGAIIFRTEDDGGTLTSFAQIKAIAPETAAASETGYLSFTVIAGAAFQEAFRMYGTGTAGSGIFHSSTDSHVTLGQTRHFTFQVVENSADGGPVLSLYRNRTNAAVDNDILGVLQFDGMDDQATPIKTIYGQFYCQADDTGNGSEDGRFVWTLIEAGATNEAMRLLSTGTLEVDLSGGGTPAQVNLFDDFDDAMVLRDMYPPSRTHTEESISKFCKMGLLSWKDDDDHSKGYMGKIQPMLALLAGAAYQTREAIDQLREENNMLRSRVVALEAFLPRD